MSYFEDIVEVMKKNAIAIVAISIAIISVVGSYFYVRYSPMNCEESNEVCVSLQNDEQKEEKIEPENLKVDVKGAVKKPGVYELERGKTIMDALSASGGVTAKGSTTNINLSKRLTDEMVIYVFTKDELKKREAANEVVCQIPKCECETVEVKQCPDVNGNDRVGNEKNDSDKKVSINKATIEEFLTLEGIGEAKAKTIVEYREKNGPFEKIEDIQNVNGIGAALYEKIKDNLIL